VRSQDPVPAVGWLRTYRREIVKVVFDVADDAYVDVEAHMAAAMARD
jgi:hypothetical protein